MAVAGWNPAEYSMHQQSRRDDMMRNLLNMFMQKKQFEMQDRRYQDSLSQQKVSNELDQRRVKAYEDSSQSEAAYKDYLRSRPPTAPDRTVYEIQRDDFIKGGADFRTASLNAARIKTTQQIQEEAAAKKRGEVSVTGMQPKTPSTYVNPTVRKVSGILESFSDNYVKGMSSGSMDPYDATKDPLINLIGRVQQQLVTDWTEPTLSKEKEAAYASLSNPQLLMDLRDAIAEGDSPKKQQAITRLIGKYGLNEDGSLNIPGFEGVFSPKK